MDNFDDFLKDFNSDESDSDDTVTEKEEEKIITKIIEPRKKRVEGKCQDINTLLKNDEKKKINEKNSLKENDKNSFVEKNSSIKIVNSIVDQKHLTSLQKYRSYLPLSKISVYCRQNQNKDKIKNDGNGFIQIDSSNEWFTIVIVTNISETLVSSNGGKYIRLSIVDMGCISSPKTLFLFSSGFETVWKSLSNGTVLSLLEPKLMVDQKQMMSNSLDHIRLSISNGEQIMILGQNMVVGRCKGTKKLSSQETGQCTKYVNRETDDYCTEHYMSMCSQLRNNRPAINSTQSLVIPKKFSQMNVKKSIIPLQTTKNSNKRTFDEFHRLLNLDNSPKEKNKFCLEEILEKKRKRDGDLRSNASKLFEASKERKGKNVHNEKREALSFVKKVVTNIRKTNINETRKKNAIEIWQKHQKMDPLERLKKEKEAENIRMKCSKLNMETIRSERISGLLASSNEIKNINELKNDMKENELKRLEMLDDIESKLESIHEKEVIVFTCENCKKTRQKKSALCVEGKHRIYTHKSKIKFFVCDNCKTRCTTFALYPDRACDKCGETAKFHRSGLITVSGETSLHNEKLSLRGREEKFLS
ncbi:hypothetical protein SNEBB_001810 [Seison nebaliae]|nr:hypothetical protein SNEBB_001810 [Seison nebaliae]